MINYDNLKKVLEEMSKMKKLIEIVFEKNTRKSDNGKTKGCYFIDTGKNTGSVRRQSMELSNALVQLRKSR